METNPLGAPVGANYVAPPATMPQGPAPVVAEAARIPDASEQLELQRRLAGLMPANTEPVQGGLPAPDDARADAASTVQALDSAQGPLATDLYAFMAIYAKLAQQMRNTAREQRTTELQAQVGSLQSAADEMVSAAEQRFSAALTKGIVQMAGGAMTIGSSAMTLKTLSANSKSTVEIDGDDFRVTPPDLSANSALMTGLSARQSLVTGLSQMIEGGGAMLAASQERNAVQADARAKTDEAQATAAQARRETAQDTMQAMGDTLRDLREKLSAIVQSDLEATRGIARNI